MPDNPRNPLASRLHKPNSPLKLFASRLHKFDVRLFRRVASSELPTADRLLVPLTHSANQSRLWIVIAGALGAFGGRFGRRAAVRGLLSIAVTSAVANGPLKWAARRKRPALKVVPKARHAWKLPTSSSFPSGHTASAFAFAVGASTEVPPLAVPLLGLAGAVGYSRVHTGVHYPGDVAAGALLGTAIAWSTRKLWPVAPHEPARIRSALTPIDQEPSADGSGLVVVVNPSAGPLLSPDPGRQIARELPGAKILEVGDELGLEDALRLASLEGRALGVAGGDGSINAGAAVALLQGKPLLVIPGGTLNHLARDLGLESVSDAIEAVKHGQTVAVDTATIDGKTFLNTASFGAYVDLVDAREKLESKIGKWPAVIVALVKVLRHFEPLELEIDGQRRKVWMSFIGNCQYRPAGFAPAWRERMDDGLLDIRIVSAERPLPRLRLVLSILTGTLGRSKVYEQYSDKQLEVRSLHGPIRLAHDGEIFEGSTSFIIKKGDKPLPIFVPR